MAKVKDDKFSWRRIPEEPNLLAAYYADIAKELADVVSRLGAFDRALSTLPVFLMAFGVAVFASGVTLHVYESAFGSAEFNDFSLFAAVFVAASAATYIAEIRIRDAADRDKNVVDAAREALAKLGSTRHSADSASPPTPATQSARVTETGRLEGSGPDKAPPSR